MDLFTEANRATVVDLMGVTGNAVVNFLGKFLFAALFVYFVTRVIQSIEKLELGESHYDSTFETRNFV